MAPVEAIAAVLVGDPTPDAAARLDRLGLHAPPEVVERARRAARILAERGRLAGEPSDAGPIYEALLADDAREAGAHYTPIDVARSLVDAALADHDVDPGAVRVWDPSCGGGVFLLAAADHLVARGADPARLLAEQLHGTDIDPGALLVTSAVLQRWGRTLGIAVEPTGLHRADALRRRSRTPDRGDDGFDLIVGNPPFQSQLRGANVRSRADRDALRERFGDLVGPYTDTAALFLLAGAERLRPGGRLALIQPLSLISSRDTRAIRTHLERIARLHGLWIAGEPIFDAAVEVCAPIIERPAAEPSVAKTSDHRSPDRPAHRSKHRSTARPMNGASPPGPAAPRRYGGRRVQPLPTFPTTELDPGTDATEHPRRRGFATTRPTGTWSPLALPSLGIPDPRHRSHGRLGDLARALAGFRDEYYGLVPHVTEADAIEALDGLDDLDAEHDSADGESRWPDHLAPLVTVGLIDPGVNHWGRRPVTFAKRRLRRPIVDLDALGSDRNPTAANATRWIRSTAGPKVLVATQTRVGEAVADHHGRWIASTPTIALLAPEPLLDRIVAVICSPIGSIAALARTAGTGRTATTIRHRTTSIIDLPLPVDEAAWDAASRALRSGDRPGFLHAMAAAYDVRGPDAERIADWWIAAAPRIG